MACAAGEIDLVGPGQLNVHESALPHIVQLEPGAEIFPAWVGQSRGRRLRLEEAAAAAVLSDATCTLLKPSRKNELTLRGGSRANARAFVGAISGRRPLIRMDCFPMCYA